MYVSADIQLTYTLDSKKRKIDHTDINNNYNNTNNTNTTNNTNNNNSRDYSELVSQINLLKNQFNNLTNEVQHIKQHISNNNFNNLNNNDNKSIITLNVGGHKHTTTKTTLCNNTQMNFFTAMFDGHFVLKPLDDGSYFIDRDGL